MRPDSARKRCLLLTAGDPAHPSGGNLYNQHLAWALADSGIAVRWHVASSTGPLPALADIQGLRQAIAEDRPDVILIDSITLACAALLPGRIPTVALMHYLPSRYPGHGWLSRRGWAIVEKTVLAKVDLVVTMSDAARGACLAAGARASHTVVVPPGRPETPPPVAEADRTDRPVRFLSVAHWLPAKGVLQVVEAFDRLETFDATLTLVGSQDVDRDYARSVRKAIAQSRHAAQIFAPGTVPPNEIAAHYAEADVFVLASHSETFGAVVVEAMGAGCPVIASRLAPLSELVEEGVNGFLVPADSVEALSDRMARLAVDLPLRRTMGRAARARARAHPTWSETTDRLARLISALLMRSGDHGKHLADRLSE